MITLQCVEELEGRRGREVVKEKGNKRKREKLKRRKMWKEGRGRKGRKDLIG